MNCYQQRFLYPIERFKQKIKVNTQTGCWEWQGWTDKNGYGRFWINGRNIGSHRISYIWFIGELESNKLVCHKCDNPCCSNPFHLFKGTEMDNMNDAQEKGRFPTMKHPSISSYTNGGCRCDECLLLWREYGRNSYRKRFNTKGRVTKTKQI